MRRARARRTPHAARRSRAPCAPEACGQRGRREERGELSARPRAVPHPPVQVAPRLLSSMCRWIGRPPDGATGVRACFPASTHAPLYVPRRGVPPARTRPASNATHHQTDDTCLHVRRKKNASPTPTELPAEQPPSAASSPPRARYMACPSVSAQRSAADEPGARAGQSVPVADPKPHLRHASRVSARWPRGAAAARPRHGACARAAYRRVYVAFPASSHRSVVCFAAQLFSPRQHVHRRTHAHLRLLLRAHAARRVPPAPSFRRPPLHAAAPAPW
jgi:hypothetical protein